MFDLGYLVRRDYNAFPVSKDKTCLVYSKQKYSYEELNYRVNCLANGLGKLGFKKEDSVSVLLHNCLEWVEIFFAVAKLGGKLVPINYYSKGPEIKYILDDSMSKWLFVSDELMNLINPIILDIHSVKPVLIGQETGVNSDILDYEKIISMGENREPSQVATEEDIFLLQYTSGTTGVPKGVIHTHSTVLWNAISQITDYGISSNDHYLSIPAFCWAAGFHDLTLATLWVGGTVSIFPSQGLSPNEILNTIEAEKITKVLLVPSILKRILDEGDLSGYDISSLNMVLSGGESLPISTIEKFNKKIPSATLVQVYGLTEFPSLALYLGQENAIKKIGSTGRPSLITEARVVDEKGNDVSPGVKGEIVLRSPATMKGYWNNAESTKETLVNGWLHTGDLAWRDEDGFFYISGRKKDMIISGGLNVYPAEIENVLIKHSAVKEATVIGIPDENWGEIGKAIIVIQDGITKAEDELRVDIVSFLKNELANYKIPKIFQFTKEGLPRNASGKVQKFKLK